MTSASRAAGASLAVLSLLLVTSCAKTEVVEAPPLAATSSSSSTSSSTSSSSSSSSSSSDTDESSSSSSSDTSSSSSDTSSSTSESSSSTSDAAGTKTFKAKSGGFTVTVPASGTTDTTSSKKDDSATYELVLDNSVEEWNLGVLSTGSAGDMAVFTNAACAGAEASLKQKGVTPKRTDGQTTTLDGKTAKGCQMTMKMVGEDITMWMYGVQNGKKTYIAAVTVAATATAGAPTRDSMLKGWKWTS